MKIFKTFFVYFLLNFFLRIKIFAANEGQPSFLSSLPLLPIIILVLILVIAGIIAYFQYKSSHQTPYNLPKGTPSQPTIPTPPIPNADNLPPNLTEPLTSTMTPPVQSSVEPPPPVMTVGTAPEKPKLPIFKSTLISTTALLALVATVSAASYFLITKKTSTNKVLQITDSAQCQSGCSNDVCKNIDVNNPNEVNYSWCSKDKRCRCKADKTAEAFPDSEQYWCEGQQTMYCKEITPGGCSTAVDSENRKQCGGTPGSCTNYTQCVKMGIECTWPASTYCKDGQCTCLGVAEQKAAAQPGWPVCQDTQPQGLPGACPDGWQDCGLTYAPGCEKKVQAGPFSCTGCGNVYYVWRYCKPAQQQPTPTPTIPTPTPTGQITPTPTLTITPTPTSSVPQCKGIRALINRGSAWTDMTNAEKNSLPLGTKIRFALPNIVNGFNASKAEFKVSINNTLDFERDTTDEMVINGIYYYYVETTTKLTGGLNFANYEVAGWLFINNSWL